MSDDSSRGSVEARLEHLLETYGRFLRGTLRRVQPRNLGISLEDLEQEVRIRLWRALRDEREIAHLPSYLYRVAATVTVDAVRRAKSLSAEAPLEAPTNEGGTGIEDLRSTDDPERTVASNEITARIDAARARLAPGRREAVALHLQGFTSAEIGQIQAWTEPKARNLVYRGLADLRESLRKEGIHLGPE